MKRSIYIISAVLLMLANTSCVNTESSAGKPEDKTELLDNQTESDIKDDVESMDSLSTELNSDTTDIK